MIKPTKTLAILPGGGSELELLINDLSIHGQFPDIATFKEAIERVMQMRKVARKFGRELKCHRNVAYAKVTSHLSMPQAIQYFDRDQRQALIQWLIRQGPFWEDVRQHSSDDYLDLACDGTPVTDTAVGEAAICCFRGNDHQLASAIPSSWAHSPIPVRWVLDSGPNKLVDVINHWRVDQLEAALRAAPVPIMSWEDLETAARARCQRLEFSAGGFEPLRGHPFAPGASRQVLTLLETLDRFKGCFTKDGQRTTEGQAIYQDYFTGDNAWFSDSSDSEKAHFQSELTFPHPSIASTTLFCPFHGKIRSCQLRVHFSWPVSASEPLYVVYIGPKITKR